MFGWLLRRPRGEPRTEEGLCRASNKVWQSMGIYAVVCEQQMCNKSVNHTGPHLWLSVWRDEGQE